MNKSRIKVMYFSGSRADYAPMKSILTKLDSLEQIKLEIVASHMHLDKRFGLTINQIKKDGFKISGVIKTNIKESSHVMLSVYQKIINQLPKILAKQTPDYLLIQGDRVESWAAATIGFLQKIPIIHVGGGCLTGSMDNNFRWGITQLAQWHFPATKKDGERIINVGKSKDHVFVIGEPSLDLIKKMEFTAKAEFFQKHSLIVNRRLYLVIFHPDTKEKNYSYENQIRPLLNFLTSAKEQIIQIYPNADSGGLTIRTLIDKMSSGKNSWKTFANLPHKDTLAFFKYADVILGNSSGAIIEAPTFITPVINIGQREKGREMAANIIQVGYDTQEIETAIKKALSSKFQQKIINCQNPYGDGTAGQKFIKYFKENVLTL